MKLKDWALMYAGMGIAIVPLIPKSKLPAIRNWQNEATTNTDQIEHWWEQHPDYNIGMVTGEKSKGIVVLDLDEHPEDGRYGIECAQDWQIAHGRFPDTWEAVTGSGGRHLFFRTFDNPRREQHLYHSSVDFQADGALIVLPPSIHPNGGEYYWDLSPEDTALSYIDDNVTDFIKMGMLERNNTNLATPERPSAPLEGIIHEGCRTSSMHRLLSKLKAMGLPDEDIRAVVTHENERRCCPPLTSRELEKEVFPALRRYDENRAASYYRSFWMMDVLRSENRNDYLFQFALRLKNMNASDETIRIAVAEENRRKCYPPLSAGELLRLLMSVTKFTEGGKLFERRRTVVGFSDISSLE